VPAADVIWVWWYRNWGLPVADWLYIEFSG